MEGNSRRRLVQTVMVIFVVVLMAAVEANGIRSIHSRPFDPHSPALVTGHSPELPHPSPLGRNGGLPHASAAVTGSRSKLVPSVNPIHNYKDCAKTKCKKFRWGIKKGKCLAGCVAESAATSATKLIPHGKHI